jgi:endonuclease III
MRRRASSWRAGYHGNLTEFLNAQTREQLEGWLPREEWPHINVLFVGLGQMTQQPAERVKLLRRCVDCSSVGFPQEDPWALA